jgi:hypothetical protein
VFLTSCQYLSGIPDANTDKKRRSVMVWWYQIISEKRHYLTPYVYPLRTPETSVRKVSNHLRKATVLNAVCIPTFVLLKRMFEMYQIICAKQRFFSMPCVNPLRTTKRMFTMYQIICRNREFATQYVPPRSMRAYILVVSLLYRYETNGL